MEFLRVKDLEIMVFRRMTKIAEVKGPKEGYMYGHPNHLYRADSGFLKQTLLAHIKAIAFC